MPASRGSLEELVGDDRNVSPHPEISGMAEREKARVAEQDVEADGKQRVDDHRDGKAEEVLREQLGQEGKHHGETGQRDIVNILLLLHDFSPRRPSGLRIRTTAINRNSKIRAAWGKKEDAERLELADQESREECALDRPHAAYDDNHEQVQEYGAAHRGMGNQVGTAHYAANPASQAPTPKRSRNTMGTLKPRASTMSLFATAARTMMPALVR